RAHRTDARNAIAEEDLLRLGQRLVFVRSCRGGYRPADKSLRCIHEGAGWIAPRIAFNPAAGRIASSCRYARQLHRGAVRDERMPIDALERHRTVTDDSVEVGGGWKALLCPQLLVPPGAEDPARSRVCGNVVAQPPLQFADRVRA